VQLAVEADEADPVTLPKGTAFRSEPFDGEPPQVFELAEETAIWPQRNRWLIGKPMPAVFFTNRKLRKGVSIKIFKNQSSAKFRHFFYATMPGGGHRGIFSRKEISPGVYHRRLPIVESFGPSITTVYEQTSGLARRLERHSADRLLRELDAQVNFILTRRGNG